jgi:hypothetical protein
VAVVKSVFEDVSGFVVEGLWFQKHHQLHRLHQHQGTIMALTIYGPIWSAKHRHLISIYHRYRPTVATTVAPSPHVAAAFMVGDSEFNKVYISAAQRVRMNVLNSWANPAGCVLRSGMDLGSCVLFQTLQLYSTRCFDLLICYVF